MGWGLIRRVPIRGDRRDHFEAEGDIWELVTRIAIGRKAREIDPVVETLLACLSEAQSDPRVDALAKKRLSEMFEFTSAADRWFQQMLSLPRGKLKTLMKLGAKVAKILPGEAVSEAMMSMTPFSSRVTAALESGTTLRAVQAIGDFAISALRTGRHCQRLCVVAFRSGSPGGAAIYTGHVYDLCR